jgi:hypothetical protein
VHLSVLPGKVEIYGRKSDVTKVLAELEPIVNLVKKDVSIFKVCDKQQVNHIAANWTNYMCTYSVNIKWAAQEEEEKTAIIQHISPTVWREHKVKMGNK